MNFARTTTMIIGAAFSLAGLALLLVPESYFASIKLEAGSLLAMSDLRALFGGLELGLGLLMLVWARRPETLAHAAFLAVTSFGGLVIGRIISLVLDGMPRRGLHLGIIAFEVSGLVLAGLAWRQVRTKS